MQLRSAFFSLLLLLFFRVHGQDKGQLLIFFDPFEKTIIHLDSVRLKCAKDPITAEAGTYIVKAWAPTRELFIDTITIKPNRLARCVHKLKHSQHYLDYRSKLNTYRASIVSYRILPLAVTTTACLFTFTNAAYQKQLSEKAIEEANNSKAAYQTGISEGAINQSRIDYDYYNTQYQTHANRANRLKTLGFVYAGTGLVFTAALFYFSRNLKKPVYENETPLLSFNPVVTGSSTGFTFDLCFTIQ